MSEIQEIPQWSLRQGNPKAEAFPAGLAVAGQTGRNELNRPPTKRTAYECARRVPRKRWPCKNTQRRLGEGFEIHGFPFPPPSDIQHKPQPSIQLRAYIIVVTCIACGI